MAAADPRTLGSVLLRTLLAGLAGVALSLSAPPVGFFWVLPLAVAAYVVRHR